MSDKPTLSISIVLFNSEDFLPQCLASIGAELRSGFAELIAIDNASPDRSSQIVARDVPSATIISASRNAGFAAGCNLAWPSVRGRYWLLLNPDATLGIGSLKDLVSWMDEHPEIGVGSPRLTDSNGNGYFFPLGFPSIARGMIEILRLHKVLPRRARGRLLKVPEWIDRSTVYVDWVPGTAMIMRREAVEEIGLLSEELFMYAEDVEWCWRLQKRGWRVGVCKSVSIRHIGGASSKTPREKGKAFEMLARSCYLVDRHIRGTMTADVLMSLRIVNNLIECLHPLRSSEQRLVARLSMGHQLRTLINRGSV